MAAPIPDFEIDPAQLARVADGITREHLRYSKEAVAETTDWLRRALEDLSRDAGAGNLAKVWGSRAFPAGGKIARDPSGSVYIKGRPGSRSRGAGQALISSGRIRGRDGGGIAIPLPAAGPRGRLNNLTPEEFERRKGVKLRPVPKPNGTIVLVMDDARLTPAGRAGRRLGRATGPGRGATVPVFVVLPYGAAFHARFAVAPVVRRAMPRLERAYSQRARGGA
jgi:hypothetical protein